MFLALYVKTTAVLRGFKFPYMNTLRFRMVANSVRLWKEDLKVNHITKRPHNKTLLARYMPPPTPLNFKYVNNFNMKPKTYFK